MPNKISSSLTWLLLCAGLFVLFVGSSSVCRAGDTYAALIGNANQLLKAGKLADARQLATSATLISPDRFEAYFLAGAVAHQQGADADARPLIEKALALAPNEKKPEVQKFLDSLGTTNVASTAAAGSTSTPAPAGPPPLDATAQRKLDALLLIPQEADQSASPDQRKQLLAEFLDKSTPFVQQYPEMTNLWVLRAVAALELVQPKPGREAAQKLLAIANPDEKVRKVLAMLERKGWTEKIIIPQPIVIANLDLKLMGIPAGSFTMGSPDGEQGRSADEGPQFQVTLTKSFWMGRTEVTQAQWAAIMGTTVREQLDKTIEHAKEDGIYTSDDAQSCVLYGEGPKYPMYYVSWDEAMEFCRRLTERERAAGRLPDGYRYTLPTEAQWEYACRAGTDGPYAGDLNVMAWYVDNSEGGTHKVAAKAENAWDLCDMQGNVREWCSDWYGNYPVVSETDPVGPESGTSRVYRGGCWYADAEGCRSAYRYYFSPMVRNDTLGFRLALAPSH